MDVKSGVESSAQKCELTSNVTLDSDKEIANNSECDRRRFYEREHNNKETLENYTEVVHNLSSNHRKASALSSSQFHARFADSEDAINEENQIERPNSTKLNEKIESMVSPERHRLNNQKSNNTIPSSVEYKTSKLQMHYYPEGGYGWVVVFCAMFCNVITSGLQLSFGIFLMHLIKQPFGREKYMSAVWLGSLSLCLSYFISPVIVSWCRRKSARLTAIAGGLVSSLGCLFASFGSQFHQVFLSYGIFLSIGIGVARESSNLMVGQYFKRKRSFVEIFVQSSVGIGVAIMSPLLDWSIGFRHWRAGLQLITCALFATFIIAVLYRPASLYHPQRRAILHLKTQRRKIREKNPQTNKPPFFDLTPLKMRSLQMILVSTVFFSFGYLSPLIYLTSLTRTQNQTSVKEAITSTIISQDVVIPSSTINLHIYFGISFVIGVILFGFLTVNRSSQCRINRQYLCQTSMVFTVLLLIGLIYLNDYYGYVIFVIAYGIAFGSFHYTNKMLVYSIIRAKTFGRAWSYVQFGQSFAILLGIPITGYINNWLDESSYHYGFVFSAISCLIASLVLCGLNPESRNNSNSKLHPFHQHSCNTSETNNLIGMAANNPDSGANLMENSHCCNCGEKLLSNDDSQGFIEYQAIKLDECRPPSPKRSRIVDDEEEEDDEDFIHAPDLGTFFSDELCNYYLQNDGEEVMALYDPNIELVKERIVSDCEIATIDFSHPGKNLICDNSDVTHTNLLRTIETVTEESSTIA